MGITQKNRHALPLGLSILVGWEVSLVVSIISSLLAGESNTQLNIVAEDGWWPPVGSSISRPSNISPFVIFTNSCMARLSSLTLSARGWQSGLFGRLHFSAQCCKLQQYTMVRRAGHCLTSWYSSYSRRKAPLFKLLGAGGAEYSCPGDILDWTSST